MKITLKRDYTITADGQKIGSWSHMGAMPSAGGFAPEWTAQVNGSKIFARNRGMLIARIEARLTDAIA